MISVIVITKNEEQNIERCLNSVKWCDEIIIIDDKSSDKTVEIAKKYNAAVYTHALNEDFSSQRNFGLSKARGDWILFVDADEIVSDALTFEISNAIHQLTDDVLRRFSGFSIERKDFLWGKELRYGDSGVRLVRLAKKKAGVWEGKVHEVWKVKGITGKLKNPIIHYPHQTVSEFLGEINFYTSIRAQELFSKKITVYWWSIFAYPLIKFIVNYFLKRGFLDGIHGLILAIIMSFHSFLVRGKLWLIWDKK